MVHCQALRCYWVVDSWNFTQTRLAGPDLLSRYRFKAYVGILCYLFKYNFLGNILPSVESVLSLWFLKFNVRLFSHLSRPFAFEQKQRMTVHFFAYEWRCLATQRMSVITQICAGNVRILQFVGNCSCHR